MKIVHVISGLDVGGAEVILEQLITFWPDKQDTHEVITFRGGVIAERLRAKNIQVHEMRSSEKGGLFFAEKTAWRVNALLRELRPDIVISSLWSANILLRPLCFAKKIPLISVLHNKASFLSSVKRFLDVATAVCFRHTRVAVCQDVADSYTSYFLLGGLAQKPVVIRNGIDVDGLLTRITARKNSQVLPPNKFVFGAVGRFILEKQMLTLIRAFSLFVTQQVAAGIARVDLPALCIVGDGPELVQARALVKELGVWDVVLLPGKQIDLAPYYAAFSAYVSVSQSEGLSIALLEALAAGLPVMVSQQSGAAGFLPTPEDGVVVNVSSLKSIIVGLERMHARQHEHAIGADRRTQFVRKNYSIVRTAQEYAQLVHKIVKKS